MAGCRTEKRNTEDTEKTREAKEAEENARAAWSRTNNHRRGAETAEDARSESPKRKLAG